VYLSIDFIQVQLSLLLTIIVMGSLYGVLMAATVPFGLLYLQADRLERKKVLLIMISFLITLVGFYSLFLSYLLKHV
jgi:hypothetical protein